MTIQKLVAGVALCGLSALCSIAWAADAAAGKDVYTAKCKMCHAADGTGNAGMAKMLKIEFRPLGSAEVQAQSDADLAAVITKGKGKMKPMTLPDADVSNVVAYVRTLKK